MEGALAGWWVGTWCLMAQVVLFTLIAWHAERHGLVGATLTASALALLNLLAIAAFAAAQWS